MTKARIEMVNQSFPVHKLLRKYYGVRVSDASWTFHCPFPNHPGNDTRKSAKYFSDTNKVYCFTEQRMYSAYDILKMNGVSDKQMIKLISPKIAALSFQDIGKTKISSYNYMRDASKQFLKRGFPVKVLDGPLKEFLQYCKEVLDEAEEN